MDAKSRSLIIPGKFSRKTHADKPGQDSSGTRYATVATHGCEVVLAHAERDCRGALPLVDGGERPGQSFGPLRGANESVGT
jgi:hypothetical protein